ncbi:hypothetical protein ACXYTP_00120 [Tsukamurella ocularis]|uniref:hypothetical protein n=1 Tax=Tsukamurella ocularis TaxID=1970234 RepID=UPI0039EF71E8
MLHPGYRPPKPTNEPPPFRDFDPHRYDMARLIATVERLIAVTAHAEPNGITVAVPVPAVEKLYRGQGLTRLRASVARAIGR